jgi:superfamily II DNA or RNA helicase
MTGLNPLRPHQQAAIDGLRDSLRSGRRRPMLQLPTGSGKTVVAAHIVDGALRKGNRIAFIVPMLSLVDQTFERFMENGIAPGDMGVIQGDHEWHRPHAPVQICSAQTLARRGMPDASVIVVDEAHIRDAKLHSWLASDAAKSAIAIGLSATPWSRGLGRVYDDLISPISMRELIEQKYLSDFRVFAPCHPDLEGVKIDAKSGDYQTGELSDRMSAPTLVADIVTTWLERAENRPTLCFGVDRPHAALIAEQFGNAGVATAYIDANTPREERSEIAKRFQAGDIKVICNIATMTTGIDLDVRCLILARPTKSEILFTQIIGRALRPSDDKDHALILDHSDTHLRLGLVTDLGRDSLNDGKSGAGESKPRYEKSVLPKECSSCGCLVPVGTKECPNCGAAMKRASSVEQLEGELVELGSRQPAPKTGKTSARDRLLDMGKNHIFAQIESIRLSRGRAPGWSAHLYKEITGVWPRGVSDTPPEEPSMELQSFIRHRDLAWAKSKRRTAA